MTNQLNSTNGYSGRGLRMKSQNIKTFKDRVAVKQIPANREEQETTEVFSIKRMLNNRILSSLPDNEFARILPYLEPVSLSSGEIIHQPEEAFNFAYFPEDAVISHLHVLENGSSSEVAMIGKEGVVGLCALFSPQPPNYRTEVINGGTALRIETEKLKSEFTRCGALQNAVLNFANLQQNQTFQRVVCNNHHTLEGRFINLLLMLCDRISYNQLQLTQDQIAGYLGVHRPGVTLSAVSLREKGFIDYSRGNINIIDREGLEQSACECYPMIKDALLVA